MTALLATSIPLTMTLMSTYASVDCNDLIMTEPSYQYIRTAASTHLFAFSSNGDLLINESEGEFNMDVWEEACQRARLYCLGMESDIVESEDMSMDASHDPTLKALLHNIVRDKVATENRWKED